MTKEDFEAIAMYPKFQTPIYNYFDLDPNDTEAKSKFDKKAKMKCRICQETVRKQACSIHLRRKHRVGGRQKKNRARQGMEFFDDDPNHLSKFICKFCQKSILDSNMIQHLKTMHEDLVKDRLNIKKFQC